MLEVCSSRLEDTLRAGRRRLRSACRDKGRSDSTADVGVAAARRQLSISAGGRLVALTSVASNLVRDDTNDRSDVFVRDLSTGRTTRASVGPGGAQANGIGNCPPISADGRLVALTSGATNLVPGDTNRVDDIFVSVR